jgi:hypothetical protein
MEHLIHQLTTFNTHFDDFFIKAKNHPTLKNLRLNPIRAMKWAGRTEAGNHPQHKSTVSLCHLINKEDSSPPAIVR